MIYKAMMTVLVLVVALCSALARAPGSPDKILEPIRAKHRLPALAAAVIWEGKITPVPPDLEKQ